MSDIATLGAAAVEMQMEAAYMFDSVGDGEVDSESEFSPAEELALAITLMSCGAAAACEAAHLAYPVISNAGIKALLDYHADYTRACSGQFLDAFSQKRDDVTSDESLQMTSLKSGSLGSFAAGFGAGLATDDAEIVGLFADLGFNLFTYAQIVDDIRDAFPADRPWSDWRQGKKTLPLLFFENSLVVQHPSIEGF